MAGVRLRPDHRRSGGRGGGRALEVEGRAAEAVGSLDSLLEEAPPSLASRLPSSRCLDHGVFAVSNGSS